jgi:putative Flp pilus-assembly TadE/G-like protein
VLSALNRSHRERGQVVVLFALLIPVIFALGAVVMDVGNWYTLRRHLQTQVDAAALAGGQSLFGCHQDSVGANASVAQVALNYAGDPTRDATTKNLQLEANPKVHAVLNSSNYWPDAGSDPNGAGYDYTEVSTDADSPKIGEAGKPCYNGWIDVKETHDSPPLLWGLIPIHPSPKTVARVELQTAVEAAGVLPLGLADNNPTFVAAIIVNESMANWQTDPAAVRGSGLLPRPDPQPGGVLAGYNVYQGAITGVNGATGGVNLGGAEDFGVFILTTLNSTPPSLSGSLDDICTQSPVPVGQVECFAYDGSGQELSFIHAYSDSPASPANPQIREAPIAGGCDGSGSNPTDDSRPYFNLNGGCSMTMVAKIEFVAAGNDPTDKPSNGGACAEVTSNVGTVTYNGGTSSSWSITFTPPNSSVSTGRYPVRLTAIHHGTNAGGQCNNTILNQKTFLAGAPYVADMDGNSGPVQYLTVDYLGSAANSINAPTPVDLDVTVGFTPLIVDADPPDDPVMFRLGDFNTPSQTQALDCDASGAAGWRAKIVSGCQGWSINQRNGDCSLPYPDPSAPDCIASETGAFSVGTAYRDRFIPDGCAADPNNWSDVTGPPKDANGDLDVSDPRYAQLFVVDRHGFTVSGKKYYPIRRFINVYVTAADGFSCPGDDSAGQPVGRNTLWGHVVSYSTTDPGATPSGVKCSFTDGGVCVPVLVK